MSSTPASEVRRYSRFADFYPFYLSEHRNRTCRRLHFVGSSLAIACLVLAVVMRNPWWLLVGLLCGYGFAWVGHFGFEKNRPASFRRPLFSFMGDWAMYSGPERFASSDARRHIASPAIAGARIGVAVAFDLDRFVAAQEPVYARVRAELAAGAKTSHWMWFVFPQLRGLGRSATAQHFGIENRAEAEAYLRHPVLGERLRECTRLVLAVRGRDATGIFGTPDDMKLHSSMTLFAEVTDEPLFAEALERYFGGRRDARTLQLLKERAGPAS